MTYKVGKYNTGGGKLPTAGSTFTNGKNTLRNGARKMGGASGSGKGAIQPPKKAGNVPAGAR